MTQGVTRIRWWISKVVVSAGPVFIAAAVLGMATLWVADGPDNQIMWVQKLTAPSFDILGLMPASLFLVAYAGAATGALFWRTVGGIVGGLVIAAVVVVGTSLLQPLVVPHTRELIPVRAWFEDTTGLLGGGMDSAYGWGGYADADGRDTDVSTLNCPDDGWVECIENAGVFYRVEIYVSSDEYPQMMLIISGLNLIFAGALLAAGAQAVRRRDL